MSARDEERQLQAVREAEEDRLDAIDRLDREREKYPTWTATGSLSRTAEAITKAATQ